MSNVYIRSQNREKLYRNLGVYRGETGQMRMQGKRRKRRRVLQKSDRGTAKLWKRKRGRKT